MKKDKMLCDPTLLSRFIDEEIEPDQYIMISNHIKHCPSCLEFLQENHSLSTFFKKFLEKELSHIHVEDVEEQVLDLIKRERVTWWIKLRDFFASKRFYVPATTMATVLLIFLTLSRYPATVYEPSAIVNSFKGNVESVMIFETQKSHHIILWFNETTISGYEMNDMKENQNTV